MESRADLDDLRRLTESPRDDSAIGRLLERHRRYVKRLVTLRLDRRVKARVDDSDIVQEVTMEAARRMEKFVAQRPMPFQLWLRQITMDRIEMCHRRHLKAECRAVGREKWTVGTNAKSKSIAMQLSASDDTPSQLALRGEAIESIQRAIEKLTEEDQEILMLRHVEQLSNHEAAIVMNMNPSTSSSRYLRALRRLERLLPR